MYIQTNKCIKIENPGVGGPLLGPAKNFFFCLDIAYIKSQFFLYTFFCLGLDIFSKGGVVHKVSP